MSIPLQNVREEMTRYLHAHGVKAASAWSKAEKTIPAQPIVSVSLRGCETEQAGFHAYLGERYDPKTGQWEEIFGKKARLTFGLDLYASPQQGEEGLETLFDTLTQAFAAQEPEGLSVQSLTCGESKFDRDSRLMKRQAQLVCTAHLYGVRQPNGTFSDFYIRGERTI